MFRSRTASRRLARQLQRALALALFFSSAPALADKVAVLPFSASTGTATKADLDAARTATQGAVAQRGHTAPTDSQMLTAQVAVKDGVADTREELRAAGRASSSQWTISARVEPHGARYRIELEVCQVQSGRVESLAREIDSAQANAQIGEMLALLLRPEGIANADIAWQRSTPQLPPATPPEAPPPAQPAPEVAPPPPPPPAEKRPAFGEGRPLSVGIGLGALAAFVRPENAQGTATAMILSGTVGYAIESVPGLELRGDFGGAVAGPRALLATAGARYAVTLDARHRIYAGPEAAIGAFFTLGGDRSARFLARGSAFAGIGVTDRVAIELVADLAVAPGGAGTLVFAGGSARGVVRF